jgi:hypothetical protein
MHADVDADGAQWTQSADELPDRAPGGVLQIALTSGMATAPRD